MASSLDQTIASAPPAASPPGRATRTTWKVPLLAALAGLAAVLFGLLVTNTFMVTLAGYTCAFALFALSINIMLGGLGEVPLGQCVFFGIGAYASGIGMVKYGLPYEATIIIGMVVSTLAAAAIGGMTLRLTGAYFSIVSWGLSGVMMVAALNLTHLTEGPLGIFGFPAIKLGPLLMTDPRTYFYVCAAVLIGAVLTLYAVRDSQFGAAIESVRQNRHLAQSVGVNVVRQRLKAFMLSAPIAALGGALCVPYTQIVTPEVFSVANTVDALLMVLIGGTGLLVGPVIGAVVFSILPYFLDLDPNVRILVFSLLIVVIMIFAPGGLHKIVGDLYTRIRGGRRASDAR
jgi:branched-chain amino acid transport system permease protein